MTKDLEKILDSVEGIDKDSRIKATEIINNLAMPPWALGRLLDLAVDLAGIQHTPYPKSDKKMVFTMASDHGIVDEGVSPYPDSVTVEMAKNILQGGAGVNVLATQAGGKVHLVDMGIKEDLSELKGDNFSIVKIAPGSNNFHSGPAMTREQAEEAIIKAYEIVSEKIEKEDLDILATGELGIGNTSPATAIVAVLTDTPVEEVTGRGSGLDDAGLSHKKKIIQEAIELNQPDKNDPIDVLAKVGGYDIAGIVGTILAAATHNKPVLIDGFISTAGALIAGALKDEVKDYMIPAHKSVEPGHKKMWERLEKEPLLDLQMRLGEGSGAAVAFHLTDCATALLADMISFDEGGVSTSETASVENFK